MSKREAPSDAGDQGRGRFRALIRGMVQGVGYRWFVQRMGARLELDGWVANRPDGSVEVLAEGPQAALDSLLFSLRQVPPGAQVTAVDVERGPALGGMSGFSIRSGSHPGD